MKLKFLSFLSILLALCITARAQDNNGEPAPIRVTTTIHGDGSKTVMQTDPENHTGECSTYDRANNLQLRIVYNFDDQGSPVGGSAYSAKGTLLYKLRYLRDGSNRVSEVDVYSTTDRLLTRQVYRFDASGKVLRIDTFDPSGNVVGGAAAAAVGIPGAQRATRVH